MLGLRIGGVIMLVTGAVLTYAGYNFPAGRGGLWGAGIPIMLSSLLFFGIPRWLGGGGADNLRKKGGLQGTARVLAVNDTGVTINDMTAIFRIQAEINVLGQVPYQASFTLPVGRTQWGTIQPGTTLPVLVDPSNPSKCVYDDGPRPDLDQSASFGQVAAAIGSLPKASPAQSLPGGISTMSTRDIVARGEHATATVTGAQLTGRTAGELAPDSELSATEAADPVAVVQLHVEPTGDRAFDATSVLRVPSGKQSLLAPGTKVPVAYLRSDPVSTTTIDWDSA